MKLKDSIIKRMKEKGWTAVETAQRANMPIPTIHNIIYGKSKGNSSTLQKLSVVFDCDIKDLLNDNNKRDKKDNKNLNLKNFRYCFEQFEQFVTKNNIKLSQKE